MDIEFVGFAEENGGEDTVRNVKFRAWDTKIKRMLYDGDYWFPCEQKSEPRYDNCYPIAITNAGVLYTKKIKNDPCGYVDVYNAQGRSTSYYANWEDLRRTTENLEFMEFIGRADENGKEAYHEDIISANGYSNWVIEWHGDGWMMMQANTNPEHPNYQTIPDRFVIIGDIHSTPDLLEVKP